MPFTLSHPAAIIPFARRPFVLSALVIGSMSPDFEKFLTLSSKASFAHTIPGLFVFCLPASLIIFFLSHFWFKKPLFSLLPLAIQERLQPALTDFQFRPPRQFALVAASILLGALTHVTWDSFTHLRGWLVERIPLLQSTLLETQYGLVRVYKILQHASTIIGASFIGFWLFKWLRRSPRRKLGFASRFSERAKICLAILMLGFAGLAAIAYGFTKERGLSSFHEFRFFVGHAAIGGMTVIFLELILFSALWHFFGREKGTPLQS